MTALDDNSITTEQTLKHNVWDLSKLYIQKHPISDMALIFRPGFDILWHSKIMWHCTFCRDQNILRYSLVEEFSKKFGNWSTIIGLS